MSAGGIEAVVTAIDFSYHSATKPSRTTPAQAVPPSVPSVAIFEPYIVVDLGVNVPEIALNQRAEVRVLDGPPVLTGTSVIAGVPVSV